MVQVEVDDFTRLPPIRALGLPVEQNESGQGPCDQRIDQQARIDRVRGLLGLRQVSLKKSGAVARRGQGLDFPFREVFIRPMDNGAR